MEKDEYEYEAIIRALATELRTSEDAVHQYADHRGEFITCDESDCRKIQALITKAKTFLPKEEPPVDTLVRWFNAENDRPRYAVRYDDAADGWKVTGLSSRITWIGIQSMGGHSLEVLKDGTWVPLES